MFFFFYILNYNELMSLYIYIFTLQLGLNFAVFYLNAIIKSSTYPTEIIYCHILFMLQTIAVCKCKTIL